jgi:hypothetical protein
MGFEWSASTGSRFESRLVSEFGPADCRRWNIDTFRLPFAESAATELVGINKPIFDDCGFDELAAPAGSGMFPWLPRPVCGPTPILPPIDLMELQDPERSPYLYAVPVE